MPNFFGDCTTTERLETYIVISESHKCDPTYIIPMMVISDFILFTVSTL